MTTTAATSSQGGLEILNSMAPDQLATELFASCHLPVRSWAEAVAASRPFADVDAAVGAAQVAVDDLTQADVVQAHDGLTRIGAPITGDDAEARWSRTEAQGVGQETALLADLDAANEAYEARFGHVFLISATGLTGRQIVDAIRTRVENDEATEAEVIKGELKKLIAIRLPKLLHELAAPGESR